MPQISQIGEIYASQLFWLAIFFGVIFVVIGLGMLPKIQATVDARDAKIAADLEVARGAREAADRLEQTYREQMDQSRAQAVKLANDAKASAAKTTEARLSESDQALNAKVESAQARIVEARTAAMSEIEAAAADAAQAIIERVAHLNVAPAEVQAVVKQELQHG